MGSVAADLTSGLLYFVAGDAEQAFITVAFSAVDVGIARMAMAAKAGNPELIPYSLRKTAKNKGKDNLADMPNKKIGFIQKNGDNYKWATEDEFQAFVLKSKNDGGLGWSQGTLGKFRKDADELDELWKFVLEDFGRVKAWDVAFKHGDDIRLNTDFLSNLSKHLDDFPNLKPDLDDLDVFNAYKKIADDVEQSYEILDDVEGNLALLISQKTQNTGAPDFWKWIHRGNKFEKDLVLPKFKNRSSSEYLQLKNKANAEFGVDLNQYDMYSQVQLKHNGSDYFVADQVYVKWVDVNGQQVIDDIVVVENKLKSTTRLTTNQNAGKAASSLEVRSVNLSPESAVSGNNLTNQLPPINTNDKWLKVYDSENGDVISGIDKL